MRSAAPSTSEIDHGIDEAFALIEQAQALLDQAGLTLAAIYLDHALSLIPDATGVVPRKRANPQPTF